MNSRFNALMLALIILAASMLMFSCNKNNDNATPNQDNSSDIQSPEDNENEGNVESPDEPSPCEHSFGEWYESLSPSCVKEGESRRDCLIDGCEYFESNIIPVIDHEYTAVIISPTCIGGGYTTYTCSCGDTYVDNHTDIVDHSFGEWYVAIAPSCNTNGESRRDCLTDGCESFETQPIEVIGHSYVAVTTAPTCISGGYTTYTCSCGDSYVDNYTDIVDHKLSDWYESIAPSCGKEGESRRECQYCEYYESEVLAATTHVFPSETAVICTICGYDRTTPNDYFSFYKLADGTYSISQKSGVDNFPKEVFIPATYNGVAVTAIAEKGFWRSEVKIDKVVLPDSITSIGMQAFNNQLKAFITSPDSRLTAIGEKAFYQCASLKRVVLHNITTIDYYAFAECRALSDIVLPDTLVSIGSTVFDNCSSLTNITLPKNLASIGFRAFSNSGLTSITIPKSVKTLEENAFVGCKNLTDAYIESLESWLLICSSQKNQNLSNPLVPCTLHILSEDGNDLTEIVITSGISRISNYTFYKCSSLVSIVIPAGVTSIDKYAFYGCENLASISVPSSLTDIGSYAFSGCTSLNDISLPEGLVSIGDDAFQSCSALTEIHIPATVTTIGEYAFYRCTALANITFGENSKLAAIDECTFYYCQSLTGIVIPDSVTSIGYSAFNSCYYLTTVTMPKSLKAVGSSVFYNCNRLTDVYISNAIGWLTVEFKSDRPNYNKAKLHITNGDGIELTNINVPDNITSIPSYAFKNCSSLISVTFSENSQLQTIGISAFENCSGLAAIYLPASLTMIGSNAFSNCNAIKDVYAADLNSWLNMKNEGNNYVGHPNSYGTLHIPDENGNDITTLVLPENITEISDYMFANCKSLTDVVLHNNVTAIKGSAFKYCTNLRSINIPEGVTSIGNQAFSHCTALTSISIPDSVSSIGSQAFYGCGALVKIDFSNASGLTTIGSEAFYNCSSLASFTIPESLTKIGNSAFTGCRKLTDVYVTDLTAWLNMSFDSSYTSYPNGYDEAKVHFIDRDGNELTEIVIPESIVNIRKRAFTNCQNLTSIIIHGNVTSIESGAIKNCPNLVSITFENTDGWFYASSANATSGTNVSSTDLSDPTIAANNMKKTYCNYYLKRNQ